MKNAFNGLIKSTSEFKDTETTNWNTKRKQMRKGVKRGLILFIVFFF